MTCKKKRKNNFRNTYTIACMNYLSVLLFSFCWIPSFCFPPEDSLKAFTVKDFLYLVASNHPVVKQSNLLTEQAQQEVRMARGFFDPKISSAYYDKFYGGKEYYSNWKNELTVPLYIGDVKLGYDRNEGAYVNPENYTTNQGLTSVGYVLPIGNGLLTDERRTTLKQAQVMQQSTEAERVKMINKLLLQAVKDYWDWYYAYHQYQINKESLDLVRFRLSAIRERIEQGDLPSIDSIEARIQEQWIYQAFTQARVAFQNSTITLSNALWDPVGNPMTANGFMPVDSFLEVKVILPDSLDRLVMFAKKNHPDIRKAELKVNYWELERKLATERLRPQIDIGAYWLQPGFFESGDIGKSNYLSDNHLLKANLSYPLFLRKERAKYKLAKVKTTYAKLDVQLSNREVENQLLVQYNELNTYRTLLATQEQLVNNLAKIREGEQTRYLIGESTLFVLNQRDQFLIKEKIKYREMKAKFAKSLVSLQWAAGKVQF
jgi:outer membrane protein TolC